MNYLEELLAEWLEYRGYFVRRNVKVEKRDKGGWSGELDVVAFCPEPEELIHVECSMDADNWIVREQRLVKKLDLGRRHIPELFGSICKLEPEQFAMFGYGSEKHSSLAGAQVIHVKRLLEVVARDLGGRAIAQDIVPESFPLLRTIQYTMDKSNGLGLSAHISKVSAKGRPRMKGNWLL